MRDEIKQQTFDINKSLEEVDEHFSAMVKQVQDEVNESRKRKEGVENGTHNKVSGCNGIKNNDGDMITNNNEEIINEVSVSYKN